MASGAQTKMVAICIMLATILFVGIASAEPAPNKDCLDKTEDVPGGTCICSKNCACAGMCILQDPKNVVTCFVDCVLKNDCKCPEIPIVPAPNRIE
ncbi:hypothetical protein PVAP13_J325601 [Panicum virgatum]|nr:hypothetical protein PVAP13_J325401 [Panicum virgatum]KAG2481144.1 hypothetical protein PVAP13_J325601 [Panicum virgatum]